MTIDLGQLKKVKVAELWKHEEHDFTPWLATEDKSAGSLKRSV